jgi:hypothetical protein
MSYQVILHGGVEETQDVWAVFMPSVKKFVYEHGAPYGRRHSIAYTWGVSDFPLDIKIEVWRDSAGIHAMRVKDD